MEAKQEKIVESLGPNVFLSFLKSHLAWIDAENKIGEACAETVKRNQEEGMVYPEGKICFIEH